VPQAAGAGAAPPHWTFERPGLRVESSIAQQLNQRYRGSSASKLAAVHACKHAAAVRAPRGASCALGASKCLDCNTVVHAACACCLAFTMLRFERCCPNQLQLCRVLSEP